MQSKHLTQVTRAAKREVIAVVTDARAMQEVPGIVVGAVILHDAKENVYSFAKFGIAGEDVEITGEQFVSWNVSKAFKYLSDYTLDRRPLVHLESGVEVDRGAEGIAA